MHKDKTFPENTYEMLVETLPAGVGLYEFVEGRMNALYTNEAVAQLCGLSKEEYDETTKEDALARIYLPDRIAMETEIAKALNEGKDIDFTYRVLNHEGNFTWNRVNARRLLREDKRILFSAVFFDVNDLKERELNLLTQQEKVNLALENSDIYVWEYDIRTNQMIQQPKAVADYSVPIVIENVPESVIQRGLVHEESAEDYLELHRKIVRGEKSVSADIHYVNPNGGSTWNKVQYITIFDENGEPIRAVGCAMDLTLLKSLEERYTKELEYQKALKKDNLLMSLRANITKNKIEDFDIQNPTIINHYTENTFTEAINYIVGDIPDLEEKNAFADLFEYSNLMEMFHSGKREISIEYQRKFKTGHVLWVSTTVKLLQNPKTNDVLCFMYTHNIDEFHIAKEVVRTVVRLDYDYVAYVDGEQDKYILYTNEDRKLMPFEEEVTYEKTMIAGVREYVLEEEKEQLSQAMKLENVFQQLEKEDNYVIYANMKTKEGEIANKVFIFSYMDRDTKKLILTRRDITEIVQKEQRQNEELRIALMAAEQASLAKSEFLSRMSHEIRTPMNAIIGMTALATQTLDNPKQLADYLSKVGISARFLLSLINDILDMSRIESGKVFIKEQKIPFEEFINGINGICLTQAEEKGIQYESAVTSFTDDYYMGDAMKLQQVLINIIANAIKFTPEGGRVQFLVSQQKISKKESRFKFVVNDTGIGINEKFLPHLFDPFEQEHSGNTSAYGGTGLGLAICKNLVTLMNGKITVNSIEGVGTEFVIELTLGIVEENRKRSRDFCKTSMKDMNVLIVDDDVIISHHTMQLLNDMEMKTEWVDSGKQAIKIVREKWEKKEYYGAIFVDWKMPDMDGIETTKKLRKIVGPDVIIIIITAYDWSAIEQEAKNAGATAVLVKPLFSSSVSHVFENLCDTEEKVIKTKKEHDFSGKRILLVEDHILNVEVAKKLLSVKEIEVEVAENGILAIEKFAKANKGYYQAVLMDIRMPVMDGITATKSIRQMKHPDAETIPIIAMTANAFEEDVEKTKEAGMNAHLAKPIEPDLLYQTLAQFI